MDLLGDRHPHASSVRAARGRTARSPTRAGRVRSGSRAGVCRGYLPTPGTPSAGVTGARRPARGSGSIASTGMAPIRRIRGGSSRAVDDRRRPGRRGPGPPSRTRATASPSCVDDLRRVGGLRHAGHIRGGRRDRADGRGQGARRVVVRDAQADRRRATGRGRPARSTSGRCGTMTVRPPGQNASARGAADAGHCPIAGACAASARSSMIPLSGGRRLAAKSASIPPGVSSATAIP